MQKERNRKDVDEEQRLLDEERSSVTYPNFADDPDTISSADPKKEQVAQQKILWDYSNSILAAYQRTKLRDLMEIPCDGIPLTYCP